jgi:hypothetical protein
MGQQIKFAQMWYKFLVETNVSRENTMLTTLAVAGLCHMTLIYPHPDSNHFYFPEDGYTVRAEEHVRRILQDNCPNSNIQQHRTICRNIEQQDSSSRVCVTNTSAGRFFTIWDVMGNTHVIFSRWD